MSRRFTLLPDPSFVPLAKGLEQRMNAAAHTITWHNFASVLDPLMRAVLLSAFRDARADEGTVWLVEDHALVPAYNTGARSDEFVGSFRQPLDRGLVSMVYATQQHFCDNAVEKNELQDKRLDQQLGLVTTAMIIVPFKYAREVRGVISCVQLRTAESAHASAGFSPEAIDVIEQAGAVLGRLIDHRLISVTTGWGENEPAI
jgi:hypothetical protein